jgi:hypothetical protein
VQGDAQHQLQEVPPEKVSIAASVYETHKNRNKNLKKRHCILMSIFEEHQRLIQSIHDALEDNYAKKQEKKLMNEDIENSSCNDCLKC